jgi:hypothetical protein
MGSHVPQPPPITIVDPSAPDLGTAEVLDQGLRRYWIARRPVTSSVRSSSVSAS